ncbi:hypothetical protein GSI_06487 [Ganoderma sinense ZZ0214-1]|uniref:Uncharacterized protein n=1 Tax=Ganoderma sinense ZZ0214-1 TaxID=1077348 RepID=A0A2G8SDG1_9APHY|nr:hypothetical protein GSI_06487 [Ganoderma sinense ZZ0214-1]
MSTGCHPPRGQISAPSAVESTLPIPPGSSTTQPVGATGLQVPSSTSVARDHSRSPTPVSRVALAQSSSSDSSEPPAKEARVAGPADGNLNDPISPQAEGGPQPLALLAKTADDLKTWTARVRSAIPYDLVTDRRPVLIAPSIQVAGEALYFLVHWLFDHADDDNVSPDLREYRFTRALDERFNSQLSANSPFRVECTMTSLLRLIKHCDTWNLTVGGAVGEGVTRNLLRQTIQVAVQVPDLWQTRGSYSTIQFLPADLAFLRLLSPEDVTTLLPWISHNKSTSTPIDLTSNVAALLMAADIDPTWVSTSASRIIQTELHLVSHTLFGLKDIYQEQDFIAFRQGMTSVLTTPGNTLDMIFFAQARNYLAAMYNRRLENVDVLLQHIEFRSSLNAETVATEMQYSDGDQVSEACWDIHYEHLVEEKFKRYLRGSGHPDHWFIRSMVSEDEFNAARNDSLLRARSFLQLMTGSDLVPSGNEWKIIIFMHHKGKRESFVSPDGQGPGDPARLHIHACFAHGDLIVDEGLRNLLIEPSSAEGKEPLLFDSWLHAAVMDPNDFNSI